VVTLRCTRKLLARLHATDVEHEGQPTTALGDWTATLVFARPAQLVVCVSERTLLPVLLPAAPLASLADRVPPAVAEMLHAIGVDPGVVAKELAEMTPVRLGRTRDRRVLGTLNDFLRMLPFELERGGSLLDAALWLAKAPCSVLGMASPRDATLERLSRLQ
jgi:hypothetical protein